MIVGDLLQNIESILLWGLVATGVMTAILYGSQGLGLSRLSLPFLVGTCFSGNRERAVVLGFIAYTIGGWLFTILYAAIFISVGFATWWLGGMLGLLHGVFLLVVILPVLPHIHPRMATEYDGARASRRLEPPGFMGLNYGRRTPLTTLLGQTCYGVILGAFYPVSG